MRTLSFQYNCLSLSHFRTITLMTRHTHIYDTKDKNSYFIVNKYYCYPLVSVLVRYDVLNPFYTDTTICVDRIVLKVNTMFLSVQETLVNYLNFTTL